MGAYYNQFGRGIGGISRGQPWTYGEHMTYKGLIVGAAINIHVPFGFTSGFKIYATNYGPNGVGGSMNQFLIGDCAHTTGTFGGVTGSINTSLVNGSQVFIGTSSGSILNPGVITTGAPFNVGDWIGIYVDGGTIVPCAIEGTLYLKIL
jgi:hypothetical protein